MIGSPDFFVAFRRRASRLILLERKITFDATHEQRAKEEAARATEGGSGDGTDRLKRQVELAENPGFKIIGLAQELEAEGKSALDIFDPENAFAFVKFVSTYFRAGSTASYVDVRARF